MTTTLPRRAPSGSKIGPDGKPKPKSARLSDGEGLSLLVKPTGAKVWVLRVQVDKRSRDMILRITEQKELLDNEKVLADSIRLRNPYVDPLNYIQVEMIRRLRAGDADTDGLRNVIDLTINGVSSGLKNTG